MTCPVHWSVKNIKHIFNGFCLFVFASQGKESSHGQICWGVVLGVAEEEGGRGLVPGQGCVRNTQVIKNEISKLNRLLKL